ncbi:MAG: nitrous oxidase accessory protein [Solirubrobacterales bacterium]|nr:nitrous oxidase accessory protein [Solirubrobacterales bacterium]
MALLQTRTAAGLAASTLAALIVLAACAGCAGAATTDVRPGPGALAGAVAAASPGDKLVVHPGTYAESITVDKPLKIIGLRDRPRPVINGACAARVTILVTSGRVSLRRLKVIGADESGGPYPSEVDFSQLSHGSARDLKLVDTCEAEYGINVFHTGALTVRDNEAVGFDDAGIYVGGIEDTGGGAINVTGNSAHGNNRGVIIEDSGGFASISVRDNVTDRNTVAGEGNRSGIFIRNSSGVLIEGNRARHNADFGVQIDSDSHDNRLFDNLFAHNRAADVVDEGTGNCGADNVPDLFRACG